MQAIDQIINSAAKTFYMSAGQVPVPVTFRGPNGQYLNPVIHTLCRSNFSGFLNLFLYVTLINRANT